MDTVQRCVEQIYKRALDCDIMEVNFVPSSLEKQWRQREKVPIDRVSYMLYRHRRSIQNQLVAIYISILSVIIMIEIVIVIVLLLKMMLLFVSASPAR